jgi:hypothetical protein
MKLIMPQSLAKNAATTPALSLISDLTNDMLEFKLVSSNNDIHLT